MTEAEVNLECLRLAAEVCARSGGDVVDRDDMFGLAEQMLRFVYPPSVDEDPPAPAVEV